MGADRAPVTGRGALLAQALTRQPSATLLAVQLLGVLLYPWLDTTGDRAAIGRGLLGLFGLAVLGLAVRTVRSSPALTWVAVLLGVPVVVLTVAEAVTTLSPAVTALSALLHALFYGYTAYSLIRYMFGDHEVTRDELFATGACFTVLAWGFAHLYVAVQIVWPGSFIAAVDPGAARSWMDLLFLSFTTLTSTGLSDIVPILPHARSVVMIEQVSGMLYVALVVARVVGLTMARARAGEGS